MTEVFLYVWISLNGVQHEFKYPDPFMTREECFHMADSYGHLLLNLHEKDGITWVMTCNAPN